MYSCSVPNCNQPRVRRASCVICNRRLCLEHLKPEFHTCPSFKIEEQEDAYFEASDKAKAAEFDQLRSLLNFDALRERASSLKGGVACSIPFETKEDPAHDMVGGMNYHFPIRFTDGETWLCRVRRQNVTSPPTDLQNAIIESEVATMRFLANIDIPVPRVHGYALRTPANTVGMAYVLMDMLEGNALDWYGVDDAAKKHVLEQLADVFITLSQHPFPAIGCLYPSESESATIGPITADDLADVSADGPLSVLGPFSSSHSYLRAVIERNLDFIRAGKAYANARVDAYLVHLYLLDSLPALSNPSSDSDEKFFLKHMDDKGDHILVDDKFNIVGIIDWEWAQTLAKSDAFASPLFLLDVAQYYEGRNELSTDEALFVTILEAKGHKELAELIRFGRLQHRISHCVGGDIENSDDFPMLFAGLQKLLLGSDDPEVHWHTWKTTALKKYRSDVGLRTLLSVENEV